MRPALFAVVLLAACFDFEGAYERKLMSLDGGGSSGGAAGGGQAGGSGGGVAVVDCLVPDAGSCTDPYCISRVFTLGGHVVGAVFIDGGVLAMGRRGATENADGTALQAILRSDCSFPSATQVSQLAAPRRVVGTGDGDLSVATSTRAVEVIPTGGTDTTDCLTGFDTEWNGVTRTSDHVAWFAGTGSTVCRWDGGFTASDVSALTPNEDDLTSAWTGPDDTVWFGGGTGFVLRWPLGAANPVYEGFTNSERILSGAATATRVWAGGTNGVLVERLDDAGWHTFEIGAGAWTGIWTDGQDMWAVSDEGELYHWQDGGDWVQVPLAGLANGAVFDSIIGGPHVLYITGRDPGGGRLWQVTRP